MSSPWCPEQSESVECAGQSGRRDFDFFFKPWWELCWQGGPGGSSMWGLGLADVAGLAVLWVATEDLCYICPFSLEIVTSPAAWCVGWLPRTRGCCSGGVVTGMLKRENWTRLWPECLRKTREMAWAPVPPLTHGEVQGEWLQGLGLLFHL